VVVSNQSVVGRGLASPSDVRAIEATIQDLLGQHGVRIDAFYYCFHHPTEGIGPWRKLCYCRKPEPGMLIRAARELGIRLAESFSVGNMWTDVIAASRAGTMPILLDTTPEKTATDPFADSKEARLWARSSNLAEAARSIMRGTRCRKNGPIKGCRPMKSESQA
jgi:D-glycero-D-manno-heptose 1,7-bisphosphate phosphatase